MTKQNSSKLYFAVFVCGAVVMIFELLASRILGPYLGTSFYTWTSIIGVIMASLSAGYAVGGKLADRKANLESLSSIILWSALSLCLTVLIQPTVLNLIGAAKWGIEIRSVLAATLLFALPSFCLAMITPYSVKIQLSGLKHSASTVGSLYALSTLGSIFGTFLAGFLLIPYFGSGLLVNILIIVLLVISLIVALHKNLLLKIFLAIAILILIYINATKVAAMTKTDPLSIDTKYNTVWLYNFRDYATGKTALGLFLDPYDTQSAMYLDDPLKLVFGYTKFYRLAEYFAPGFQKALMIGGCAYSFPKYFLANYAKALIDVVEIDPGMTEIAQKYFHLKLDNRLGIYHEDGRTYLNETTNKYDVIYGDAFNSSSAVPFQLTTQEAAEKMKSILNDNGVAILNLIGAFEGPKADFTKAEYTTFKKVFDHVHLYTVHTKVSKFSLQNIILVAVKGQDRLSDSADSTTYDQELQGMLKQIVPDSTLSKLENPAMLLTDDFAPVEYYKYKSLQD